MKNKILYALILSLLFCSSAFARTDTFLANVCTAEEACSLVEANPDVGGCLGQTAISFVSDPSPYDVCPDDHGQMRGMFAKTASGHYYWANYVLAEDQSWSCFCQPEDTDGDGIIDDIDPNPNNAVTEQDFSATVVARAFDDEGNIVYERICYASGDCMSFGTTEGEEYVLMTLPNEQLSMLEYNNTYEDGLPMTSEQDQTYGFVNDGSANQTNENIENTGEDTSANTQDIEWLEDITQNQDKQLSNDQEIANLLQSINENTARSNSVLNEIAQNPGGVSSTTVSGPSADEIAGAIGDELGDYDENSHGQTGLDTGSMDISITEGVDFDGVPSVADPDGQWITDAMENNPAATAFENSGFTTEGGSSSITADLGRLGIHTLDLAPLEDGFILAGNLLFALCGLLALFVAVKG